MVHPATDVPVTEYVVVVVGEKITPSITPFVHVYVDAPPPLNDVELPIQITELLALAVTVGFEFIVTVDVPDAVHVPAEPIIE